MNLKSMLEYEEGRSKKPYKCSEGHWTIGVGHKITDEGVDYYRKIGGLTNDKIDLFLSWDIEKAEASAQKYAWFKDLNEPRQAVIISMIFQMGAGHPNDTERKGFLYWTDTHKHIASGDFEGAASAMLDSKWATQTPNRARRHAKQLRTGEWCNEYFLTSSPA